MMPFISAILSIASGLMASRGGQIVLAFVIAWVWSGYRANEYWRATIAADKAQTEAAYQTEIARQALAAQEIAAEATMRAQEEIDLEKELRAQIEAFNSKEPRRDQTHTVCSIDDDFVRVVRRLDATGRRSPKAPGRSR